METLEELEWCLDQLENIQTDRSANQITTNKVRNHTQKDLDGTIDEDTATGRQIVYYLKIMTLILGANVNAEVNRISVIVLLNLS